MAPIRIHAFGLQKCLVLLHLLLHYVFHNARVESLTLIFTNLVRLLWVTDQRPCYFSVNHGNGVDQTTAKGFLFAMRVHHPSRSVFGVDRATGYWADGVSSVRHDLDRVLIDNQNASDFGRVLQLLRDDVHQLGPFFIGFLR